MTSFAKLFHDYFQPKKKCDYGLAFWFLSTGWRSVLFGTVCCYNSEEALALIKSGRASGMKMRRNVFYKKCGLFNVTED